jgi:hypothetical protein
VRLDRCRELAIRELTRVDRVVGAREAERAGDRAHRGRRIAREHLHRHVLTGEEPERRLGVRADAVGEHDQGDRRDVRRRSEVERSGASEHDDALALGRVPVDAVANRPVIRKDIRCTEQPRTMHLERGAAPLPARRERHRVRDRPAWRLTCLLGDRAQRGVRRRVRRREARKRLQGLHAVVQAVDLLDRQAALGERAGLVDTQHVDTREPFDGGELLDEHPLAGESHHRDRERDRRQEHEPLGHHRDRSRHRARHRVAPAVVRAELAREQERGGRNDRPGDVAQDQVDP